MCCSESRAALGAVEPATLFTEPTSHFRGSSHRRSSIVRSSKKTELMPFSSSEASLQGASVNFRRHLLSETPFEPHKECYLVTAKQHLSL